VEKSTLISLALSFGVFALSTLQPEVMPHRYSILLLLKE
jgi:hypothetical protein